MTEILPGIHQVEGVDPSPDFSTHVYLVRNQGSGWTLVDTGLPGADAAVLAYLKKIGIGPHDVRSILLTHCHNDHVGSLARLARATGAKSYAHWLEAAFIAARPRYDGPGVPPSEPFDVAEKIKDGDSLDVAGGVVAFHTPGHTPGHTAYYSPSRKLVFSGDLFFGVPKLALTVPQYTHHTLSAQVSARRISELEPDALLSYHGGPFLHGASAELKVLVRTF